MARLRCNGWEVARVFLARDKVVEDDNIFDRTEIVYSFRSNGWVLFKRSSRTRNGDWCRSGWKRLHKLSRNIDSKRSSALSLAAKYKDMQSVEVSLTQNPEP